MTRSWNTLERNRSGDVTFAAREWVIPVPADSVQTRERGFSNQRVSGLTFKRHSHPNAEVCANHDAISKRPRVRATLELVGWREGDTDPLTNMLIPHSSINKLKKNHIIWFGIVYALRWMFVCLSLWLVIVKHKMAHLAFRMIRRWPHCHRAACAQSWACWQGMNRECFCE